MAMNDPLSNALSNILNAEKIGKSECIVRPASKLIKEVLTLMNKKGYIGELKILKDGKSDVIKITLLGKINKCGVIKPRYSVKKDNFEKFEKRYLPAKDFGFLIVSTSKGILMTHIEIKEKNMGGCLIAYVY